MVSFRGQPRWQPAGCRTSLVSELTSADDYRKTGILEQWQRLDPELRDAWHSGNPHALGLFRFLDFFGHHLTAQLPRGSKVRILVDRLDWCPPRQAAPGPLVPLGCTDGGLVEAEVFTITDKKAAAEYTRFLGLVDSEAWAFGRVQTRPMSDGTTMRSRALDWQSRGGPKGEECIPQVLAEALVATFPATLREYIHAMLRWEGEGKSFVLGQGP